MVFFVTLSFVLLTVISRLYIFIPEVICRSYKIFEQCNCYETLTTFAQLIIIDMQNIYGTRFCGILRYILVENLKKFENGGLTHAQSHM